MKYQELGEEVDDVEEEWKTYKDEFVGNAEELVEDPRVWMQNHERIRNGGQPKLHQQNEAWKVIQNMRVNGNQPDGGI